MQSYILRCKHCQKEYSTSEEGASLEYCPECQNAINDALKNITVKFKEKQLEIDEPLLFPLFDKIKKEADEEHKNSEIVWPGVIGIGGEPFDGYDNIDIFIHNSKKYLVKYNDETPDEKHIFVSMEYDILNDKFTGKPWYYSLGSKYTHYKNAAKSLTKAYKELVENPVQMEEPKGDMFFIDYPYSRTTHQEPPRLNTLFKYIQDAAPVRE